ncbi:unnamed protein product [Durusdinium trenchii]|uniref:Uncharacterized protein n=1 Tax=Durusdinium trenchii TaxID=1381693 RepID=A0ABP0RQJ6_9DINO
MLWRVSATRSFRSARRFCDDSRILWAPGMRQVGDDQCHVRLGGKIRLMCTEPNGYCVVGARGEVAVANAMRSLAWASEVAQSPLDFKVRWQEEPGDMRSLRFFCDIPETWTQWKQRWAMVEIPENDKNEKKPLDVTPYTDVTKLSIAISMRHRKYSGAAIKMNPMNDTVLSIVAKALASLPHTGREEVAHELSCVIKWPGLKKDSKDLKDSKQIQAGKFIYGHVMWRPTRQDHAERLPS